MRRAFPTVLFVRIALFPDGTKTHYEALARELDAVDIPNARRVFIAGQSAEGWQVVQAWDTKEDLDQFNADMFLPALLRLGSHGFPSPPVVRDFYAADFHVPAFMP